MENIWLIAIAVISYLIGSFSTSQVISRKKIEEWGRDSWGTMSTIQKTGSKLKGLVVLVGDMLKGFLPVFTFTGFAPLVGYDQVWAFGISAFCVTLGHNYSINLNFHGGRGLATGLGVIFAVNWILALACLTVMIFSVFATELWMRGGFKGSFLKFARGNLLGRVTGIILCLVAMYFFFSPWEFYAVFPMMALIIFSHKERLFIFMEENKEIIRRRFNIKGSR
jgi:acyl-phosphate glycerol 3-phosphate acyltransferase